MKHTIHIENWHPTRINQLVGVHWGKAQRCKRADLQMIGAYAAKYETPKATGRRRVTVTIALGKGQRGGDPDSYTKSLLDALVGLKLLVDDNRQWLELEPIKYERAANRSTTIELEDIESVTKLPAGYADGAGYGCTARTRGKK